jgi:flagellar biosynthesis protein FliR
LLGAARVAPVVWLVVPLKRAFLVKVLVTAGIVALLPAATAVPHGAMWRALVLELAVGLTVGVIASLPVRAAQAAGGVSDALGGDEERSLSTALALFGVAIFMSLDGPMLVLRGLVESYRLPPAGEMHLATGGATAAIAAGTRLIGAALMLAAPVMAAVLLTRLAFVVASRAEPTVVRVIAETVPMQAVVVAAAAIAMVAVAGALAGIAKSELGTHLSAALEALKR